MFHRKKIGLALSGGGPKGFAHIGVIKKLIEHNIPIDYIAGTSIGALVGGWYAAKKDIDEIEVMALKSNWPQIVQLLSDVSLPQALVGGTVIEKFLQKYLGNTFIEHSVIPFAAVATDLNTGNAVTIREGKLTRAIRASISIPLVFKPYEHQGKLLVDGALSIPTPILPLKDMGADIIIAVNMYDKFLCDDKKTPGFFEVFNNSMDILCHHLSKGVIQYADLVISPNCSEIGWKSLFTTRGTAKVIQYGEDAAMEKMHELQHLIKPTRIERLLSIFRHRLPFRFSSAKM